jgi:hypothetical protein
MRWFGYDHFLLKGLEKVRTEWRFTPKAFGADHAGVQPQTSAQPGELRKTDGHPSQNCFGGRAGGLKAPRAALAPEKPQSLVPTTPVNAPTTARPDFSSGMKNLEPQKILLAAAFNRQSHRDFSHRLPILLCGLIVNLSLKPTASCVCLPSRTASESLLTAPAVTSPQTHAATPAECIAETLGCKAYT